MSVHNEIRFNCTPQRVPASRYIVVSSPDQIFHTRPVDSSKNRVWHFHAKTGASLYMAGSKFDNCRC